jgi:hypothetical protein
VAEVGHHLRHQYTAPLLVVNEAGWT